MSTLRRRYKTVTPAKRCPIPIPAPGSTIPWPCGGRVFRAGKCVEHYNDWRNEKETRWGTEAVSPRRRERNGKRLPRNSAVHTVPKKWVKPEEVSPEPVDVRRTRQGVSQETQDWLIDRAALRRARRLGVALSDPPTRKELAKLRGCRV